VAFELRLQKLARDAYDKFSPLDGPQAAKDYVNFYADLHTVVDKHIATVLDTLEEMALINNTIILRRITARGAYSEPLETDAFYDHRDLLPRILDLAGAADPDSYGIGRSIVPLMRDPSLSVRDHTTFSYDDLFFLPPSVRDPRGRLDLCGLFRARRFRTRV
jgi:choline-sulfatase